MGAFQSWRYDEHLQAQRGPLAWSWHDPDYNTAILSRLLTRYAASGTPKARALITQISPAAWRHILVNGQYTFQSDGKVIDLDAFVAGLDLV